MSKNFERIKKSLSLSTTLPVGVGGSSLPLMGTAHVHKADGSCCGYSAGQKDYQNNHSNTHVHHGDSCCSGDEEDDITNPRGSCC